MCEVEDLRGVVVLRDKVGFDLLLPPHASLLLVKNKAMDQKRQFTGIWIPRQVVEDERLDWIDRALYGEIQSYDDCFKTNESLGNRIGETERNVQKRIAHLKELGYVEQTHFDGRLRHLRACLPVRGRHVQPDTPDTSSGTPIDNSIDNNIELSKTDVLPSELDSFEDDVSVEDDEEFVPTKTLKKRGLPKSLEPEIQKMWALWPGDHGQWKINKTVRSASEILLREKGMEKIANAVKFWLDNKKDPFCPDISTPYKLGEKWEGLVTYKRKKKYGRQL